MRTLPSILDSLSKEYDNFFTEKGTMKLNLQYCRFENDGSYWLSEAIRSTTLQKVETSTYLPNIFGEEETMINKMLENNSLFHVLEIRFSDVDDVEASLIASALKVNTTLHSLDLHSNIIGDRGAALIADAISQNITLKSLDIRNNSITHKGVRHLVDALKENTTLTSLRVSCPFSPFVEAQQEIDSILAMTRDERIRLSRQTRSALGKCQRGDSIKAAR